MTKDIGKNGNLFGGNMLAWMDEAAAIFAHQFTGEEHMVTLKFNEILFKMPVHCGEIIEFHVDSVHLGKTSISFDITAYHDEDVVFSTRCTFVAVDKFGKKKLIKRRTSKNYK